MLKTTLRIVGGLLLLLIAGLGLGYLRVGMRGAPLVSADPSIPLVEVDCGRGLRGARCGMVKAPLDYDAPGGEQIDVFSAYFSVRGVRPDRRLSLQLIGGEPGQPLLQSLRDVPMWIFQLRALDHGMLIIEPRGLAPSADLTCPAVQEGPGKRTQEFGQTPNALVERCAAEIGPRRIHFNTPNTAGDFERVRRALAIGRLDIAGFSYGTLLAAVYAGMFPTAVRTLTFNGSLPVAGWAFLNPDQHAAVRRRFEQVCARSRQCGGGEAWRALGVVAESLRTAPRPVRAADGSGGGVIVTPAVLAGMIIPAPRPRSDDDPTLVDPIIGALLDGARGNWSALETLAARYFVTGTFEQPDSGASAGPVFNQAVWFAVQCSEFAGMPWSASDDIATRQAKFDAALRTVAPDQFAPFTVAEWAGRKNDMNYYDQCMHWPPSPGEPARRPLTSFSNWAPDLPVLLLNGDYDMQTTHELARGAAEQFAPRTTWYASFENFGHVIMPRSACARALWFELVRTRRIADLDVCRDDGAKAIGLLGVPEEDVALVKLGADHRLLLVWGRPTPEHQIELARSLVTFWHQSERVVERRLHDPGDDLTSELIRLRGGDDTVLSLTEITSLVFGLLFAGHETTTAFLTNAVRQLLARSSWPELVRNPAAIPVLVEELLRLDTSVIGWRRLAIRETAIGGVPLPAGARVLVLLGAANHDPARFHDPGALDPGRPNLKDHLAFGFGIHYCLGAALARLEAKVVLECLGSRLPNLRLVPEQQLEFHPNVAFRGPRSLLVRWD